MLQRHSKSAIIMHWFNAFCWIMLLCTGFALLDNKAMQPVGMWWVQMWQSILGSNYNILTLHLFLAGLWMLAYAFYIIKYLQGDVLPFLREIFVIHPKNDVIWMFRKTVWLLIGTKLMRQKGLNPELPASGFYNAGQRMVAILAVLCSLALVATGLILLFVSAANMENLVQWSLLLHFVSAGLMAILLPVHIYMAALAPGEGPALQSMFTGVVPEEYAKHHNPLWYVKLKGMKSEEV